MEAKVCTRGKVSAIGKRETMDDAIQVAPNILKYQVSQMHLFAVFDGHGVRILRLESSSETLRIVGEDISNGTLEAVLSKSFQYVDDLVVEKFNEDIKSTAVVVLVTQTHLITANYGDSRVVLYRGSEAIPLSTDHKPKIGDERSRSKAWEESY
ncbi:hypothetical protein OSB04_015087 [Centaurea solstitialis]|uniref:protein-serine/threonine phosphatase n=1 Tax=Centaurea solstitialis TaxID=347529 RepID=A0AA38W8L4_9ASTR|nr:hypothetical protein OSB04_015087 [Centaurea solstitialis]